ncbi:TetR/AcrR family transcriptional regulator [Flavisphingomonas formosensis]|uniref:TetR/AcrR family transcriptional regulator n=1 Tax=Flavisphingomonas formosensis TaxID=861534 RepID=UPI0012F8343C|nr:helix-turn-helix domain-containing protein [Sphingomonas formosensis]
MHWAEQLFATKGLDAVSLREIAVAMGSKNNNVVQYHFGSKERLFRALFDARAGQMEGRRAQMVAFAEEQGRMGDAATLLEIICLPHLDLVDERGAHPYAAFIVQYALRYWRADDGEYWTRQGETAPFLHRVIAALVEALSPLPAPIARTRVQLCNFLFLNAVLRLDNRGAPQGIAPAALLHDALFAAKAALLAGSAQEELRAGTFTGWFEAFGKA